MKLSADATILFQGDSITDAGRRESKDGLGNGYVAMIRAMLSVKGKAHKFRIVNRGVGGDRTAELLSRWKKDCLDVKPGLLSIMIGVNDVWRLMGEWNGQKFIPFDQYCANYRELIRLAQGAGIEQFVLMSPSSIADNTDAVVSAHLDERAEFVKILAKEINAVYVPIRETQKRAFSLYPEVKWTADGCHPTPAGHALFAQAWLDAVKPA